MAKAQHALLSQDSAASLLARMPAVRGRLRTLVSLAKYSWFRTGGPAEIFFEPADEDDLADFLSQLDPDIAVTVLGVGSNLLVRDGGVEGVVIKLGAGFANMRREDRMLHVGAAAMDVHVARFAAEEGLTGLEFLVGVPGTVGGALRMNAGAYGREMKDIVFYANAFDRSGRRFVLGLDDLGYGYRTSAAPADFIFTGAVLGGTPGDKDAITARMDEISNSRAASQPIRSRTGGSTFKNPGGGQSAWELVDRAGCRGMRLGGACISPMHANFLVCDSDVKAWDVESLGEEVRRRVLAQTGVRLAWEIRRIGFYQDGQTVHRLGDGEDL